MRKRTSLRRALAHIVLSGTTAALVTGCTATVDDRTGSSSSASDDVAAALAALPEAKALAFTEDGVPTFVVGELGRLGPMDGMDGHLADAVLRPSLGLVVAPFRLRADQLALRAMRVDEQGGRHFRYTQVLDGVEEIGADLVVHVDRKGTIAGVNGTARGDLQAGLGRSRISQAQAGDRLAGDGRFADLTATGWREVYIETIDGELYRAYEAVLEGARAEGPVRDKVYVDVESGAVVAHY